MFVRKISPLLFALHIVGVLVWSTTALCHVRNEPTNQISHRVLPFASTLDLPVPGEARADAMLADGEPELVVPADEGASEPRPGDELPGETPTDAEPSAQTSPEVESPAQALPERIYTLVNLGHALQLKLPNGEESLSIPARIDARIQGRRRAMNGSWRGTDENSYQASLISPVAQAEISVKLDPESAQIRIELELTYRQELRVDFERWRWRVHNGSAEVLDRGYRRIPLPAGGLFVDHLTPHVGQWFHDNQPAFALLGDDTFEGVWYNADEILFELDHLKNHPHTIVDDCYEAYDGERPWFDVSQSLRFRNERVRHRITLIAGEAYPPVVGRWPNGYRAAMAFVDHADNSQLEQLRAIAFGSSDRDAPSSAPGTTRGFLGHDIPITKTVFDSRQQLGHPRYRELLEAFHRQGSEIAPHSITGGYDRPPRITRSLQNSFADFQPRTWVDHQPDTNCEAINNWGGEPNSPESTVNMLYNLGIRYFWEAPDPIGWKGLNLLRVDRPLDRGISFYPAMSLRTSGFTPWLFVSTWLYLPVDVIAERFKPQRLDAFENEAGLLIGHTYLSKTDADRQGERSVLRRDQAGNLVLHPKYDAMLAELGRRRKAGTLWLATISELGDWILRRSNYRIGAESAETAKLTARDGSPIPAPPEEFQFIPWPGSTFEWKAEGDEGESPPVLQVHPFLYDPQVRVRTFVSDERYADAAPSSEP